MCQEAPIIPRTTSIISDGEVTYTCDTGHSFVAYGHGNYMVTDCGCTKNWTVFELFFATGCTRNVFCQETHREIIVLFLVAYFKK